MILRIKILILLNLFCSPLLFGQWSEANYQLNMAAYDGDTAKVDSLIAVGVQVDLPDDDQRTALFYAAQMGHVAVARRLLEKDAHIDHLTWSFKTPLLAAIYNGQFEMAEFLIRQGANVHIKDKHGRTGLHYAVKFKDFYMADMLCYYEMDIDAKDQEGMTPLSVAAFLGHDTLAWMLCENGCLIDPVDTLGNTPFLTACEKGHLAVVELLVGLGTDIHALNKQHYDGLQIASFFGHDKIVDYLLSLEEHPEYPGKYPKNPWLLAKSRNHAIVARSLRKAGIKTIKHPHISAINVKIDNSFSSEDYFLGGSLGIHDIFTGCYLNFGYQARIGHTPVLVKEREHLFYQYYEKRHLLYFTLERKFKFNPYSSSPKGLILGLRQVYNMGKYRGTTRKVHREWMTSPTAGLFLQKDFFCLILDYQYLDFGLEGLSPHRINLSFSFDFNIIQSGYSKTKVPYI